MSLLSSTKGHNTRKCEGNRGKELEVKQNKYASLLLGKRNRGRRKKNKKGEEVVRERSYRSGGSRDPQRFVMHRQGVCMFLKIYQSYIYYLVSIVNSQFDWLSEWV